MSVERLGVRALDEFTVQVDLRAPAPFFLRLLSCHTLFPVPRQAIEPARRSGKEGAWTDPRHIISSGAFALEDWRPRDCAVLKRNPRYFDADTVRLERVSFLLTPDAGVGTNLYKSGRAHLTNFTLPPYIARALNGKRDLATSPAFGTLFPSFNVQRPPFDNVLIRYAFNMATDKMAIANVFGFGRTPARTLVPPLSGYRPPRSVFVKVNGSEYDVLNFDVRSARDLLAIAGFPQGRDTDGRPLKVGFLCPVTAADRLNAEILQQQWHANLGVEVVLTTQEFSAWLQNASQCNYSGVTENQDWGFYLDPNWFLEEFTARSFNNFSGWADPVYDSMLSKANTTLEPESRLQKLAECEAYLLRAMPCIPEFYDVWAHPQKPYLRGICPNIMDVHPLKYAWIDTNWRPQ
jgi:oligopeptide transport system substrate-binding protein